MNSVTWLSVALIFVGVSSALDEYNTTESFVEPSFMCPQGLSGKHVFADYRSDCQDYHICENGNLRTFQCPLGTIFNINITACDASNPPCYDVAAGRNYRNVSQPTLSRNKRSLRHVVSIPKAPLKKAFEELTNDVSPILVKLMRSSLPGLFSTLVESSPQIHSLWARFGPKILSWIGRGARSVSVIYTKIINEFPSLKFGSNNTHYEVHISEGLIDVYHFARDVLSILYFGEEYNKIDGSITQEMLSNKRSLKHVLTIPKEPLHNVFDEFSKEFLPLIRKVIHTSLPGLFNTLMETSPQLQTLWTRVAPTILPWVGRRVRNLSIIFSKLFTEFPSLKIASTDVSYEIHVSEGLVKIYHFARDLLSTLYYGESSKRVRRSSESNMSINFTNAIASSLGKLSTLFFKVMSSDILSDIFWSESSVGNVQTAFWSGISSIGPAITHYFSSHNRYFYDSRFPNSRLVAIPKAPLRTAYNQFKQSATPPIKALTLKYLPRLFTKAASKVPKIIESLDRFMPFLWKNWNVLVNWFLTIAVKYDKVVKTSNSTHYNFFTISEFKSDMTPGKFLFTRMITDFWGNEPDSVFPLIFGNDGMLSNVMSTLENEQYGRPKIAVPAHQGMVVSSSPVTTRVITKPCYTTSSATAAKTGCTLRPDIRKQNSKQTKNMFLNAHNAARNV